MSTFETNEHLQAPAGTAQLKKPKDGVEALEKQLDRIPRQKPVSERQLEKARRSRVIGQEMGR